MRWLVIDSSCNTRHQRSPGILAPDAFSSGSGLTEAFASADPSIPGSVSALAGARAARWKTASRSKGFHLTKYTRAPIVDTVRLANGQPCRFLDVSPHAGVGDAGLVDLELPGGRTVRPWPFIRLARVMLICEAQCRRQASRLCCCRRPVFRARCRRFCQASLLCSCRGPGRHRHRQPH